MDVKQSYPWIGIAIILEKEGKVLLGKRIGFVPGYSVVSGHLEIGETFEQAAMREVKEETNLDIQNPQVVGLVNVLDVYEKTGRHYVAVVMGVKKFAGKLKNMEPEKCEGWDWFELDNLPQPMPEAVKKALENYKSGKFY